MHRLVLLILGCIVLSPCALAYRPFDSTDAAVAEKGAWEIEFQPLGWRHNDEGAQWISPALILNYGFAENWEAVLEGRNTVFDRNRDDLNDAAFSIKSVLREGTLQEKSGVSIGSEFSVFLPGINTDDGAGLGLTALMSDKHEWGAWHLNAGPMLARDGKGGWVAGGILEGPADWPVRPVGEIRYEKVFGDEEVIAFLAGVILPVKEGLALDLAFRHAREGGRPDEQIRAGVTFDLQ